MRPNRIHVLERSQRLALPVERAFDFYADARNLERVTPPWLDFRIATQGQIEMRPGALIDYRLRFRGVPVRWRTRIDAWNPPHGFVDLQLRGPYALWEHSHSFEPDGDGAVMIGDRVRYALPLGPFGTLAHTLLVRRDLERIFDYRRDAVVRHIGVQKAN
jgi:ligand-binding SRPBCC domain-containing protein